MQADVELPKERRDGHPRRGVSPERALLRDCVINGDSAGAARHMRDLLVRGTQPEELLAQVLIPAMDTVGRRFSDGEFFLPEMLVAAQAMQECLRLLEPTEREAGVHGRGTVVLGTVAGDLHDIGKGILAMMLRGSGFTVHDLGIDVAPQRFVKAAQETAADIVALSALLSTTMPRMREIIDALEAAGIRERHIVLVGGAPITTEFAVQIGADGYASDAGAAAKMAIDLMAARSAALSS